MEGRTKGESYNQAVRNREKKHFTLTRPNGVRPPNLSRGEAEVVYICLESDGAKPKTFNELVKEAERRKLAAHFKTPTSTTIEESLTYWLNLFEQRRWIRVIEEN